MLTSTAAPAAETGKAFFAALLGESEGKLGAEKKSPAETRANDDEGVVDSKERQCLHISAARKSSHFYHQCTLDSVCQKFRLKLLLLSIIFIVLRLLPVCCQRLSCQAEKERKRERDWETSEKLCERRLCTLLRQCFGNVHGLWWHCLSLFLFSLQAKLTTANCTGLTA